MEIKILCHCGVKFKFDVEPVDGHMPFAVKCPGCGMDATEFANAHIRQNLGLPPPPAVPVAKVISAAPINLGAANLRVGDAAAAAPVSAPAPAVRLTRATPAHAATPAAPAPAAPPVAPPVRPVLAAAAAPARTDRWKLKGPPNFGLGLVGALLGTIVGVGIWMLVHSMIDTKSKFLILGVGFFAGLGARYLSRDEGSQQLGMIAAALTLMGVFGTQYYFAYQDMFGYNVTEMATEIFEMQAAEAKKVLAKMPNESDDEIRAYLVSSYNEDMEDEEENEKIDPKSITEQDIKDFREHMLPEYKDLASGKATVTESLEEMEKEEKDFKESPGVKLWLVVQGFGMFKLGLLVASCGMAYRISANAA